MSATFAYEDPLLRPQTNPALSTRQKTAEIFKEMGRNMWRSGKGFGKVGALYAGVECVIEGVSNTTPFMFQGFRGSFHKYSFCFISIARKTISRMLLLQGLSLVASWHAPLVQKQR